LNEQSPLIVTELSEHTHKNKKTRHPHDVGNTGHCLSSQITINITEIMFMIWKSEASSLVTYSLFPIQTCYSYENQHLDKALSLLKGVL
jgi:hypothetical protein